MTKAQTKKPVNKLAKKPVKKASSITGYTAIINIYKRKKLVDKYKITSPKTINQIKMLAKNRK